MAQVKSDGEPMGIYTVTCEEIPAHTLGLEAELAPVEMRRS